MRASSRLAPGMPSHSNVIVQIAGGSLNPHPSRQRPLEMQVADTNLTATGLLSGEELKRIKPHSGRVCTFWLSLSSPARKLFKISGYSF
ncbi:hypothetical protein [Bradyrhizobium sp. RT10b]|uniref:hypothetical protein n=1 Tax=Bradyrhizobium sp. RT10b TaxID=3156331 RepID=UPI00339B6B69